MSELTENELRARIAELEAQQWAGVPEGFRAWLDAFVTVSNLSGIEDDERAWTWPNPPSDDHFFDGYPQLTTGDLRALHAMLSPAHKAQEQAPQPAEVVANTQDAQPSERDELYAALASCEEEGQRMQVLLTRIVAEADSNPFNPIGHVIEHVVPEARALAASQPAKETPE